MTAVITTERLRLRRYTLEDADQLFEVFDDPYARAFYPQMSSRANIVGWIEWNLRNYNTLGFGLWAMEAVDRPGLIGDCGLVEQDIEGTREVEIGYHVIAAERRKGYATEAARACLAYAFRETDAKLVCSLVRPKNTASRAVAQHVHREERMIMRKGRPSVLYFTRRPVGSD